MENWNQGVTGFADRLSSAGCGKNKSWMKVLVNKSNQNNLFQSVYLKENYLKVMKITVYVRI